MRVLILATEFPPGPGGIGVHASEIACGLAASGWHVHVLATQLHDDVQRVAHWNAVQPFEVEPLPRPTGRLARMAAARKALRRRVAAERPDVLIATGGRACWLAAGSVRVPWIAVGHGTEFGLGRGVSGRLNRWAYRRAQHVVAVSEYTRQLILRRGIEPQAMSVIHNGADAERFHPPSEDARRAARAALDIASGPVLLTVGSVTERKGQHVVIRALPDLVRRWPDLVYLMAGMEHERPRFEKIARDCGMHEHVRFLGPVDAARLEAAYHASDVFLMTSTQTAEGDVEGFGIAVIEAALCGLPAVVSDTGGLPEAVADGETGHCVTEGDPSAVAGAVAQLLAEEGELHRMGKAARQRALEGFTWPRVSAAFDALLQDVAAP